MPVPKKPCGYCDSLTHWPYQCYKNPYLKKFGWQGSKLYDNTRVQKKLKKRGKQHVNWMRTRRQWFIENLAESYECYLCGRYLEPYETTLDHVIPRSRAPHLRYEMSNLKPCCWSCNTEKGSKVYEQTDRASALPNHPRLDEEGP